MTAINKYNKSIIYTIRSPHSDKYYIGSTTQILCKRLSDHTVDYKRHLNGTCPNITSSYKILELGGAYIEMLKEINCENRNQLEKREGELIREHKSKCVNKNIPCRTNKEWEQDNHDERVEKKKQYYIDNIEKKKQYYIENIDKISEQKKQYRNDNKDKLKEKKKQHYIENIDKILEKQKQYRNDNKDRLNETRRAKYAEKTLLKDLKTITI